ncbi:pleckstrin homology domain-containing family S member 1 [Onychostruthus taczanowskii]|uniref:pleckstrin homology domain-containing family S member 1 n=1 Tax=Onychostruthus taczanowskii TaxID=356909 RepID=UPI001B80DA5A|nr:pleckstrin homology domain-containing family S member 1 [Onychostruthus taczanowskii]
MAIVCAVKCCSAARKLKGISFNIFALFVIWVEETIRMASTNKINSAVRIQNIFCPEGEVCKHGFLVKSPPHQLFSSQNSWKRRLFVLSKSSTGNYILKYLKGQHIKGSIAVDQIISIQVGISNAEIMETVRKMFKCLPEQVMSISTGNRCYYLIGESRQEIDDWVTLVSSVCREDKSGCCPQNQDLPNAEVRSRTSSLPLFLNSTDMASLPDRPSYQKENGSSEDKNRPYSDPGPHQAQCDSPRGVFPSLQEKILGSSEENLLLSDPEENMKKDEEDYYQTPSNILAKCTTEVPKPDPTAESDVPVQEKPVQKSPVKENIYMSMKSLKLLDENCQLTCRRDGLPSPPECQNNSACPRDLEADKDTKFPESSTSLQPTIQRRQNSLPLSVVHLSILLSQVTDEMQLQKLDIFVPLADINNYLKFTEAAGRICISQWAGPRRLGCLFNHGDHVVAVNDLQPQGVEEAYFFISRSTRKEVKLTVCRIPHSDTFHAKGCSCS